MSSTVMGRLNWVTAGLVVWVACTASASARVWTDDFGGATINSTLWTESTADGNTITLTGGHVEMYQGTTSGSSGLSFKTPLEGDFDVQVDYSTRNWDMGGHDQQRMGLVGSGTNGYSLSVQRVSDFWFGGEVYLTYYSGASWNAGTSTTNLQGKLRLTRTGSTIIGYFWNASTNSGAGGWERAYDNGSTPAYSGPFSFSLSIWSGYSGTQIGNVIEFDNVSVTDASADGWDAGYVDVGGGWKWLSWFGFFADIGNGWIYHNEHGWLYTDGTTPADIWFWTSDLGWLWTSSTAYPSLYRSSSGAWLWYQKDSDNPRWFYNFTAGSWESH